MLVSHMCNLFGICADTNVCLNNTCKYDELCLKDKWEMNGYICGTLKKTFDVYDIFDIRNYAKAMK